MLYLLVLKTRRERVLSQLPLLLSPGEQTVPETVSEIHQESVDVGNDMDRSTDIHDGKLLKVNIFTSFVLCLSFNFQEWNVCKHIRHAV